ncbi:hypothetical protein AS850_02920 [Frondihabitans sp. 762G35]|uniref:hypothetical protein n=1 Tax=Frondihabitans sp. 762G35 TaxID=1446794 RepID=UPI000D2155A6|nr:hypothetical protein [Frondihabitans sp. 762G35]ARC56025.1 hypothetical protein AS850_02920 [Frondihabitans sp. 762G35]
MTIAIIAVLALAAFFLIIAASTFLKGLEVSWEHGKRRAVSETIDMASLALSLLVIAGVLAAIQRWVLP